MAIVMREGFVAKSASTTAGVITEALEHSSEMGALDIHQCVLICCSWFKTTYVFVSETDCVNSL